MKDLANIDDVIWGVRLRHIVDFIWLKAWFDLILLGVRSRLCEHLWAWYEAKICVIEAWVEHYVGVYSGVDLSVIGSIWWARMKDWFKMKRKDWPAYERASPFHLRSNIKSNTDRRWIAKLFIGRHYLAQYRTYARKYEGQNDWK